MSVYTICKYLQSFVSNTSLKKQKPTRGTRLSIRPANGVQEPNLHHCQLCRRISLQSQPEMSQSSCHPIWVRWRWNWRGREILKTTLTERANIKVEQCFDFLRRKKWFPQIVLVIAQVFIGSQCYSCLSCGSSIFVEWNINYVHKKTQMHN